MSSTLSRENAQILYHTYALVHYLFDFRVQIVGPAIYGLTFGAFVETYPQVVRFISFGVTFLAVMALLFVILPKAHDAHSSYSSLSY